MMSRFQRDPIVTEYDAALCPSERIPKIRSQMQKKVLKENFECSAGDEGGKFGVFLDERYCACVIHAADSQIE